LPGADTPLFTVKKGQMGLGLGIHGEPGISDKSLPTAKELAKELVSGVLEEIQIVNGSRIAVIVNGLGATKYEELFILWDEIQQLLVAEGFTIIDPEVGELVTSLDMAGCSLTIMTLDDELENLWTAPTDTPAYKKGVATLNTDSRVEFKRQNYTQDKKIDLPTATQFSKDCGKVVIEALQIINQVMIENEQELGRIDAVAGDGDHGRGMVKGSAAAYRAGTKAMSEGAGAGSILVMAGKDFAAKAGGTSGVLWGAALEAIGRSLGDKFTSISKADISIAISAGADAIQVLGKANLGDKTMLDCLIPFTKSLNSNITKNSLSDAWKAAAEVAIACAQDTSKLSPKIGRARPLASKSIGTPDAGATSMSLALNSLSTLIGRVNA
jgi:dihydroxyacetone kinase